MYDICDIINPHKEIIDRITGIMPDDEIFNLSSAFFKALSDPTRTKILWVLDQSELCVCDLASILNITPSAISHQLSGLRKDKMVKFRKSGKEVFYSLADDHVRSMLESVMEHIKE